MTLGEIKAEALRLMHIETDIDGTTVGSVAEDDSFGMLYSNTVGALNRAFADLETRRILPLKRAVLTSPQLVVGAMAYFSTDAIVDLFEPHRLTVTGEWYHDSDHPYRYDAGRVTVTCLDEHARYELLYYPQLARVTHTTPNSTEIELPEALAAALPYYIKADVHRVDEPNEANDARNWYESALAQYAALQQCGPQGSVIDVFEGAFG